MLLRSGLALRPLDEHERALVGEMLEKDAFHVGDGGPDQTTPYKTVSGGKVKALLSDTTSGGLYLNPVYFDEAIITFPLLHSQLFPYIDVKEMPRSGRVETASIGNPTATWGTAEGTALTPFSTAGLVSQIFNSTFTCSVAVEIGRDLLSDSPVNVGEAVVQNVGQRMLEELDSVVAAGDGVTQPQGIVGASGMAAANSELGTGGPLTVSDAEALIFAVPLQYRLQPWNAAFVMNDTSYRRFRSIPVGPSDERRVFGNGMMGTDDSQKYQLFEYPVRISPDLPNTKVIFGGLKKYRMWRRSGFEVRWSDVGKTLMLANEVLLVVRGRYAGQVVDANAFSIMTDAQA